jgi:hypothetical protein
MDATRAERDRRERFLVWLLAAPTIAAVLGVCAVEAWQLVIR